MRALRAVLILASILYLPLQAAAAERLPKNSLLRNTAGVDDRSAVGGIEFGVLEETPNQRRLRLGEVILAAEPANEKDFGELIETPNDTRRRLSLPMPWDGERGVAEETPNHRRARLADTSIHAEAR